MHVGLAQAGSFAMWDLQSFYILHKREISTVNCDILHFFNVRALVWSSVFLFNGHFQYFDELYVVNLA